MYSPGRHHLAHSWAFGRAKISILACISKHRPGYEWFLGITCSSAYEGNNFKWVFISAKAVLFALIGFGVCTVKLPLRLAVTILHYVNMQCISCSASNEPQRDDDHWCKHQSSLEGFAILWCYRREAFDLWKMSHLIISLISLFSSFAKMIYGLEKAWDD